MFLCRTRELLRTEMFARICDGTIMPYIIGPVMGDEILTRRHDTEALPV
jgi:hypothetical protein